MSRINKTRNWWAVLYPENMISNWESLIADTLKLPYAYCAHTSDIDSKSEHRKDHVHLIVVFPNTTTYSHALAVFRLLGERAVNKCEACVNIRYCYDYLIHATESCKKAGKHLYDASARVTGNNFDIGAYEQISQEDKNEMLREMLDFVVDNGITDITTFYECFEKIKDPIFFDVFKSHGALIERICKGNYHARNR